MPVIVMRAAPPRPGRSPQVRGGTPVTGAIRYK